jgi:hypothetical protein
VIELVIIICSVAGPCRIETVGHEMTMFECLTQSQQIAAAHVQGPGFLKPGETITGIRCRPHLRAT